MTNERGAKQKKTKKSSLSFVGGACKMAGWLAGCSAAMPILSQTLTVR